MGRAAQAEEGEGKAKGSGASDGSPRGKKRKAEMRNSIIEKLKKIRGKMAAQADQTQETPDSQDA